MRKLVQRYDNSKMEGATITPQGYLRAPALATRIGVFKYLQADGSVIRELRHPDHVFEADSMATLSNVPLTNNHPKEMIVTPKNAKALSVGFTGEAVTKEDDKFLKTMVTVTDQDAIDDVKSGKQELSCGYVCEHDEAPGQWEGQDYDVIQKNIRYNHLAIVDRGRAGPQVRMRLDGEQVDDDYKPANLKEQNMVKMKIGDKDYDVEQAVKDAYDKAVADAAAAKGCEASMKGDADKAKEDHKKEIEALQGKNDSLTSDLEKAKAVKTDADTIKKAVDVRIKLLKVAATVLPKEKLATIDGLSDLEIKKEVILADHPKADLKEKSDAYVDARFDSVADKLDVDSASFAKLGEALDKARSDDAGKGDRNDAMEARQKSMDKARDAWKEPCASAQVVKK